MSDPRTELEIIDALRRERDSLAGKLRKAEARLATQEADRPLGLDALRIVRQSLSVNLGLGPDGLGDDVTTLEAARNLGAKLSAAEQRAEKAEAERDAAQRLSKRYLDLCDASLAREEKLARRLLATAESARVLAVACGYQAIEKVYAETEAEATAALAESEKARGGK